MTRQEAMKREGQLLMEESRLNSKLVYSPEAYTDADEERSTAIRRELRKLEGIINEG